MSETRRAPVIREAAAGDRAAIHDVTLAACEEYAARMPAALWRGYRDSIVATLADPAPATQLVAEEAGAIVIGLYPGRRPPTMPRDCPTGGPSI